MIVDITRCAFQRGYLPKKKNTIFHPFFPTNNAAFRREALEKVGGFDPRCQTGEDVDMSIRIAQAGYELWYEPSAKIRHMDRRTLSGLARQWFRYGSSHPYLFEKHVPTPRLQFYRFARPETTSDPMGVRCLLDVPFPISGMVFLSSFHAFHLGLLAALAGSLLGAHAVALAGAVVATLAGAWYFSARFAFRHPLQSVALAGIRYAVDCAYFLGGLLGGLRRGMVFLEAVRSRRLVRKD